MELEQLHAGVSNRDGVGEGAAAAIPAERLPI